MTEQLLQKLEEKMMTLLGEVEDLRKEVARLNQENSAVKQENFSMKSDREVHVSKLEDLVALLDSVNSTDIPLAAASGMPSSVTPFPAQA